MSDSLLGRGKGRQALGWVTARGQRNPPCRSATAVAPVKASQAFTPSNGGKFHGSFSCRLAVPGSMKILPPKPDCAKPKGVLVSAPKPITTTLEGLTTAVVSPSFPPFCKEDFQTMGKFLAGLQGRAKPVWW